MKPAYTTTTPAFEEDDDYDREYMEKAHQRRHDTLSGQSDMTVVPFYLTNVSEENVHVGLMFGSKALVQLVANPLVGPWTNKQVLMLTPDHPLFQNWLYDPDVHGIYYYVSIHPSFCVWIVLWDTLAGESSPRNWVRMHKHLR